MAWLPFRIALPDVAAGEAVRSAPPNGGPDRFEGQAPVPHLINSRNNGGFQGFSTPGCFPSPLSSLERPGQCPPRTGPLLLTFE